MKLKKKGCVKKKKTTKSLVQKYVDMDFKIVSEQLRELSPEIRKVLEDLRADVQREHRRAETSAGINRDLWGKVQEVVQYHESLRVSRWERLLARLGFRRRR